MITARNTFKGFVTALREHLQLDSELFSTSSYYRLEQNFHNGTLFQRYGRSTRLVRKHSMNITSSANSIAPKENMSFEDSRKRNLRYKCKKKWTPGHRCKPEEIQSYVRNQFQKRHTDVHTVSELAQALESEAIEMQNDQTLATERKVTQKYTSTLEQCKRIYHSPTISWGFYVYSSNRLCQ